jgi:uncharacterized protein
MSSGAGKIIWFDLTVEHADAVRDFYQQVVGWSPEAVEMGEYADYNMKAADGATTAGICHARGDNRHQPPQWMLYITVDDLDHSLTQVAALGGTVLVPTRGGGGTRFAVIQDPAGAVCTLFEQRETPG